MSLYNPSEFLQRMKDEAEIVDIPLPVTDDKMWEHFCKSALIDFSQLYPMKKDITIGDDERIDDHNHYTQHGYFTSYRIPFHQYYPYTLLGICACNPRRVDIYADFYIPNGIYMPVDDTISLLADTQAAAALRGIAGRKPTGAFRKPDIVNVYNGYGGAYYDVTLKLSHDPSLTTVPDTAFIDLLRLAVLDLKAYLYGKLKRKNGVNTGNGETDLKIDDWQGARQEYNDLIKEWKDSANIDFDEIGFW